MVPGPGAWSQGSAPRLPLPATSLWQDPMSVQTQAWQRREPRALQQASPHGRLLGRPLVGTRDPTPLVKDRSVPGGGDHGRPRDTRVTSEKPKGCEGDLLWMSGSGLLEGSLRTPRWGGAPSRRPPAPPGA